MWRVDEMCILATSTYSSKYVLLTTQCKAQINKLQCSAMEVWITLQLFLSRGEWVGFIFCYGSQCMIDKAMVSFISTYGKNSVTHHGSFLKQFRALQSVGETMFQARIQLNLALWESYNGIKDKARYFRRIQWCNDVWIGQ